MAKIKFISPVDEARGTIGGCVFSANASGSYVKSRRQPVRSYSVEQSFGKGVLSQWPNEWRALDQSQRDDWNTWAADPAQARTNSLGQTYYVSGFGQFVCLNSRLYWFLLPFITDPPVDAKPSAPLTSNISVYETGSASTSEIEFDEDEFSDMNFLLDFAVLISQTPVSGGSQFRAVVRDYYPMSSPYSLQIGLEGVFGTLIAGQRWIARLARVDDCGQISDYLETMGNVEA